MSESSLDGDGAKWNDAEADEGVAGFEGEPLDFEEGVLGGADARKGLACTDEAEEGCLVRDGVVDANGDGFGLDGVEYGADRVERAELGPAAGGGDAVDLSTWRVRAVRAFEGEVDV
jgi:hypothetical protein